MKLPMEPIPTEQMVDGTKAAVETPPEAKESRAASPAAGTSLSKLYPWLLGFTLTLCAVLCWMYVTKPVINVQHVENVVQAQTDSAGLAASDARPALPPMAPAPKPALVPAADALPGETPTVAKKPVSAPSATLTKQLTKPLPKSQHALVAEWEKTNIRVQHILSAETADGKQEKVELNVPVRYLSRTLRWTPEEAEAARGVLGRLMMYERNLTVLKQEGQLILKEWNDLLARTVPAPALRADSLSLPYNHGQGTPPKSIPQDAPLIQVDP